MSLFGDAVANKEKEEIVGKLKSYKDSSSFGSRQGAAFRRPNFPTLNKDVSGLKLSNCIDQDSGKFFSISRLRKDFLYLPVCEWNDSLSFHDGLKIMNSLKCVNSVFLNRRRSASAFPPVSQINSNMAPQF